jgi:hypothetical protein
VSLSLQVQQVLWRDPLSAQLFCFPGRRGDVLKVTWHDGQRVCLKARWSRWSFSSKILEVAATGGELAAK